MIVQNIYDALWATATPLLKRHLQKRVVIDKEDEARLGERFGVASQPRPAGKLVWLHGASVGESVALLTVVAKLRAAPNPPTVLVTTGTVTSARIMGDRLPEGCLHQFLPLDRRAWVEHFLDHWRPDGVVWSESEIWPGVLAGLKRRHIPAIMLNARLSAKTVRNWRYFRPWMRGLLSAFSHVFAQTEVDRRNWQELGGQPAQVLGNLKFVVPELPFDAEKLALLHTEIGNRPLWVFSSIHPGEEEIGGRVHQQLKQTHSDLLTVIVPRHPHRGAEFADHLRAQGMTVAQRSKQEPIRSNTDIYLADTIGEMGLFYRLGKIVAMGGSFVPHGGQNPIEPAKLKGAILYGPHMFNFTAICAAFEAAQSVLPVANDHELAEKIAWLLATPHEAAAFGEKAWAVTQSEAGSLDKIWAAIADWRGKVLG